MPRLRSAAQLAGWMGGVRHVKGVGAEHEAAAHISANIICPCPAGGT